MPVNTVELVRIVDNFRELDPNMGAQIMLVFLTIARHGTCTQRDLSLELGMTEGSASRAVAYWSDTRFDKQDGMDMIERFEDPRDRRYKMLRLNAKGRLFYEKLKAIGGSRRA